MRAAHSSKLTLDRIAALSQKKQAGQDRILEHDQARTKLAGEAEKEADATRKAELLRRSGAHKAAADAWRAATALYDTATTKLMTADEKGLTPLTTVIREAVVADALAGGSDLLLVKMQASGGACYTKKNLWTTFGAMPFYHTGGAVLSFALLEGTTGRVLASDIVPVHSGFVKANRLQKALEK